MRRAGLALLVAAAAACGPSHPGTGYVKQRAYAPAHEETYQQMVVIHNICTTDGKGNMTCTPIYGSETRYRWVPDRWSLLLENCYSQPDCLTEWRDVARDEYDRYPEGKHYPRDR